MKLTSLIIAFGLTLGGCKTTQHKTVSESFGADDVEVGIDGQEKLRIELRFSNPVPRESTPVIVASYLSSNCAFANSRAVKTMAFPFYRRNNENNFVRSIPTTYVEEGRVYSCHYKLELSPFHYFGGFQGAGAAMYGEYARIYSGPTKGLNMSKIRPHEVGNGLILRASDEVSNIPEPSVYVKCKADQKGFLDCSRGKSIPIDVPGEILINIDNSAETN